MGCNKFACVQHTKSKHWRYWLCYGEVCGGGEWWCMYHWILSLLPSWEYTGKNFQITRYKSNIQGLDGRSWLDMGNCTNPWCSRVIYQHTGLCCTCWMSSKVWDANAAAPWWQNSPCHFPKSKLPQSILFPSLMWHRLLIAASMLKATTSSTAAGTWRDQ